MPSPDSDAPPPSAKPCWRLPLALLLLCSSILWGDIERTEGGGSTRTGFVGELEQLIDSGDAAFATERNRKQYDDGPHWDKHSIDTPYRYWLKNHKALANPTSIHWSDKQAPYFVPPAQGPPTV